jgi:hypothetical protein
MLPCLICEIETRIFLFLRRRELVYKENYILIQQHKSSAISLETEFPSQNSRALIGLKIESLSETSHSNIS